MACIKKNAVSSVIFLALYAVFTQVKANGCYSCPSSEYCCKRRYYYSYNYYYVCQHSCVGYSCDYDSDCASGEYCSDSNSECKSGDSDKSEGLPGWVVILVIILAIAVFVFLVIASIYRCCHAASRRRALGGVIVVHPVNTGNTVLAAQQQQGYLQPQQQHDHQGSPMFQINKVSGTSVPPTQMAPTY